MAAAGSRRSSAASRVARAATTDGLQIEGVGQVAEAGDVGVDSEGRSGPRFRRAPRARPRSPVSSRTTPACSVISVAKGPLQGADVLGPSAARRCIDSPRVLRRPRPRSAAAGRSAESSTAASFADDSPEDKELRQRVATEAVGAVHPARRLADRVETRRRRCGCPPDRPRHHPSSSARSVRSRSESSSRRASAARAGSRGRGGAGCRIVSRGR